MPNISINALNGLAKTLAEKVLDYNGFETVSGVNVIIRPKSKKAPNSSSYGSAWFLDDEAYVVPRGWYIFNTIYTNQMNSVIGGNQVTIDILFKVFGSDKIYKKIKVSSEKLIYIDSDDVEEIIVTKDSSSSFGHWCLCVPESASKIAIYVIKDHYLTVNDTTVNLSYLKYCFRTKDDSDIVFDDFYGKYEYYFKKFDMPKPGDVLNIGYNSLANWLNGDPEPTAENGYGDYNRSVSVVLESNDPNEGLKVIPMFQKTNQYSSDFLEIHPDTGWEGDLPTISNIPDWIPLPFRDFKGYIYNNELYTPGFSLCLMKDFTKYYRRWREFSDISSLPYIFKNKNFGPDKPSDLRIEGCVLPLTIEDLISFFKVLSMACPIHGNHILNPYGVFCWIQLVNRNNLPAYHSDSYDIGFSINSVTLDYEGNFSEDQSQSIINLPTISINFPYIAWIKQRIEVDLLPKYVGYYNGVHVDYEILHKDIKWVNSQDGEEV